MSCGQQATENKTITGRLWRSLFSPSGNRYHASVECLIPFIVIQVETRSENSPLGTGRSHKREADKIRHLDRRSRKEIKRKVARQKHDWVSFNFVTGGVVMQSFVRRERGNVFLSRASHASKPLRYPSHQLPCGTRSDNNENQSCGPPSLGTIPCPSSLGPSAKGRPPPWLPSFGAELGNQKISNECPAGAPMGRRNKEIDQPCQTPRQTNSDVQVVCG